MKILYLLCVHLLMVSIKGFLKCQHVYSLLQLGKHNPLKYSAVAHVYHCKRRDVCIPHRPLAAVFWKLLTGDELEANN